MKSGIQSTDASPPADFVPLRCALAVFAAALALVIGMTVTVFLTAANAPRRDGRAVPNRCPLNCHSSGVPSDEKWTAAGRMYAAPPSAAARRGA